MKTIRNSDRRYLRGTVGQMLVACGLAVAMLLVFSLAGCSSSSSPSTAPAVSAGADTPEVPLIFTVRTDTAEGIRLIFAALGARLVRITQPDLVRIGEANCQFYAERSVGIAAEQGHFAGALALNPGNPAAEAIILCWLDRSLALAGLERWGQDMKPPRKVMRYDPATRTVTFGPSAMLPT